MAEVVAAGTDPNGNAGQIGRYRTSRVLGTGAFATVWLAFDPELETPVAIKVLADNWSRQADVRERFLTEARILRRISSPRVVGVHDIGETDERPYFVMDYLDGGTLAEVGDTPDASERLRLGAETAYAVHDLHQAGVAHRDIKPSNLLLDATADPTRVLISDLGTAKLLADGTGLTVTVGTPAYMAPEQVNGAAIDARSDVYAVGAVTYELLSGRKPFPAEDVMAVVVRPTDATPEPIAAALGLPSEVDDLLMGALAHDPESRPADARVLGDALADLAVREGAAPTPGSGRVPRVVKAEARRWPTAAVLTSAVLIFLVAAVVGWLLI